MALGKRKTEEQGAWLASGELPRSPGHPFYDQLNRLLAQADFDRLVETLCAPYYAELMGAPSIPPGMYFRMLFVGYLEGIDSQRGIAWRCADSLSLRSFIGLGPTEPSPDHSSLTRIRRRLPQDVFDAVFQKVLGMIHERGLLKGRTVAVDATLVEANAALKAIVRKDTSESYQEFLERLATEAGIEDPTPRDLQRMDKTRKGKKMSNQDWESRTDPDNRIMKMKDGRTLLSYKVEHVMDIETDVVLSAKVFPGDVGDGDSMMETLEAASENLAEVDDGLEIKTAVADNGYHGVAKLVECEERGIRAYIPESREAYPRVWTDKPEGWKEAFHGNRRRCRGKRNKRLQRLRRERMERSFAHTCETGRARRSWLRGVREVAKRYLMQVTARNLGFLMRALFGIGTPRTLQGEPRVVSSLVARVHGAFPGLLRRLRLVTRLRSTARDFSLSRSCSETVYASAA